MGRSHPHGVDLFGRLFQESIAQIAPRLFHRPAMLRRRGSHIPPSGIEPDAMFFTISTHKGLIPLR